MGRRHVIRNGKYARVRARLALTGLHATDSVDFLKRAFEAYESYWPFAILRSAIDLAAYLGNDIITLGTPGTSRGWATQAGKQASDPTVPVEFLKVIR